MAGRKPKLLDGPELLDYALRALSGRAMSTGQLRTRLHRRAATPPDVDEVLLKLKEAGYLDDARFAESYATARRDNQGFGRMRVLQDLRSRRVAGGIADKAVQDAFAGLDEAVMVEQYLARKYRSVNLPAFLSEDKNLASAFRRLRGAGFSSSTSIRVLKRYAARADELEDAPEDPEPTA
jgi:regulatory protein